MAVEYIGTNAPDGASIGLSTSEKISAYGVTPIVQRSGAAQAAVATTRAISSNATSWHFSTSTQANAIVTLVNEMREALVAFGIIKGSA